MIESLALRWILSIIFGAAGCYYLNRCLHLRSTFATRICSFAHVAMTAAMIAMVWPWGMRIPAGPQVTVFVVTALWFLLSAMPRAGQPGRTTDVHHAVMMGGTAWMIGSMPAMTGAGSGSFQAISVGLAGYFGAHALWSVYRTRSARVGCVCERVMSMGMAIMLVAVL